METNIAAVIVMLERLLFSWLPNFVQAEEARKIKSSVSQALNDNARRNEELVRLHSRVSELEAWIVDEVDPMSLGEPRRSEWHTLHEKLHPENYK